MSQSVHKIVVHEASFNSYFLHITEPLSESAVETGKKANKSTQISHASLTSFAENTGGTANYLIMASDIQVTARRKKQTK